MDRRTPDKPQPHAAAEHAQPEGAPTLPAWKTFTVQFTQETGVGTGVFAGRVEHLNSGCRERFASQEQLLAALLRMLADIEGRRG